MTYQPPKYIADSIFSLPFDPNVTEVEQWLNSLPIIDGKRAGELILLALQGLNRLDLDFQLRFEILDLIRNKLAILDACFDKRLLDAAFPLCGELQGTAQLRIQLHQQLALGFTMVCNAKAFKRLCRWKKQSAASAIQRAMLSWHQVLFQTFFVYENVEQEFWPRVYGLVLIAEEFGLYSVKLTDDKGASAPANTIECIFKSILVFAFAQSNGYRQRDMIQIYSIINSVGYQTDLFPKTDRKSNTTANFSVDLAANNPPGRFDDSVQPKGGKRRYLKTEKMIKTIVESRKSLELVGDNDLMRIKPTKRVLVSFVKSLSAPKKRRSNRESEDGQSNFYIGLDGLVCAMSASSDEGSQQFGRHTGASNRIDPAEMFTAPDYEVIPLEYQGGAKGNSAGKRASRSEFATVNELLNIVYKSSQTVQIWDNCKHGNAKRGTKMEFAAKRVNSSVCGYGFALTKGIDSVLKVGDLIGIPGVRSNMEVGAIRWIATEKSDTLTFGIELFSPQSEVVTVHSASDTDSPVQGLFLPEIAACRQPSSIVLPCSEFRPGDQVYLTKGGNRQKLNLKKLCEETGGFGRFTL